MTTKNEVDGKVEEITRGICPQPHQQKAIEKMKKRKLQKERPKSKKQPRHRQEEEEKEVETRQDEKENAECPIENRVLAPKSNGRKMTSRVVVHPPMESVQQLSRRISRRQSIIDPTYSPKISPVVATRLDLLYIDKDIVNRPTEKKKKKQQKKNLKMMDSNTADV
jgi:hypothetical protein